MEQDDDIGYYGMPLNGAHRVNEIDIEAGMSRSQPWLTPDASETSSSPIEETASSGSVDIMVLSFNCAANLIDVEHFANRLDDAFNANNESLLMPEIVVISLQEVAPLSFAFIGDYFLGPYLTRFEHALNTAAWRYMDRDPSYLVDKAYTLVKSHNVGYTAIMLFVRDASCVKNLQEAEVAFGAADLGNKGAVGLRFLYAPRTGKSTELTFVATHLAAMEWNLARRNSNWLSIMRGLTFENPEAIVEEMSTAKVSVGEPDADSILAEPDLANVPLLNGARHHLLDDGFRRQLHDLSVFKPSSHLFVAGDFNYRISTASPVPNAPFPSFDPESEYHYSKFFRFDQLTQERRAGRTMHGLTEHEVRFPPTYKYLVDKTKPRYTEDEHWVPEWKFAPHRYPSWTDRILFLELPSWIGGKMRVHGYDALPVVKTSDHRPVFLRVEVPLIPPKQLAPPEEQRASAPVHRLVDPRVRLPVEIDPEAWERRAAARRKEVMVGWSMYLWSTMEGALVLGTLVATSVAGYLLYRSK